VNNDIHWHNEIIITILILLHNFRKITRHRYRLARQVVFAQRNF